METKIKICTKCQQEKTVEHFYKNKACNDGFVYKCKTCVKKDRRQHYHRPMTNYKSYREKYPERWNEYFNEYMIKYKQDPIKRARQRIAARIWWYVKKGLFIKKTKCEHCQDVHNKIRCYLPDKVVGTYAQAPIPFCELKKYIEHLCTECISKKRAKPLNATVDYVVIRRDEK